jgi:hypothetical protein
MSMTTVPDLVSSSKLSAVTLRGIITLRLVNSTNYNKVDATKKQAFPVISRFPSPKSPTSWRTAVE